MDGHRLSSRRGMSLTTGAIILLLVLLGGSLVVIIDQSDSLEDRLSSLGSDLDDLKQTVASMIGGGGSENQTLTPSTIRVVLYTYPKTIQIATGVNYQAWTFNGTVPAPTIFARQGDTIVFTLVNNSTMGHSMDFHAAEIDWATAYATAPPGSNKSFTFVAHYPGVFMYHCGTPPVLEHIGNGMYGAIVVQPATSLPPAPGGTYVLIESEFYISSVGNQTFAGNYTKMLTAYPDYVVFNGKANQYMTNPLPVKANQLVRLYLLNVGPSLWEAFHVIGAIMDKVYLDGNPANVLHGMQTVSLAPSSGAIVDMYFRDPGGKNPFVTHAFAWASKGALGIFQVEGGNQSTTTTSTTAQNEQTVRVVIPSGASQNLSSPGYFPSSITVVIGMNGTVTWVNQDPVPHTVTASDKSFDSGQMNANDVFTVTFTKAGIYHYSCSYHPWMKGTVIVVAMH